MSRQWRQSVGATRICAEKVAGSDGLGDDGVDGHYLHNQPI
jgi:hypothetical protein